MEKVSILRSQTWVSTDLIEVDEELVVALVMIFKNHEILEYFCRNGKFKGHSTLMKAGRQKAGNYKPVNLTSVVGKML